MKGTILFDRYRLLKIIGHGGMGTVYLAENIEDHHLFAIKVIPIKNRTKASILKEPILLRKLKHPSIIQVIDVYDNDHSVFIVMEYIDGHSLKEALAKERKFSEKQVLEWANQLCDVLGYLHTLHPYPIIYRDMKPSNILLDKNNQIKLIDFGIACEYREEHMGDSQIALTRGYCAPEQYTEKVYDARSDIYSLGVTIYHLVTGISPNDHSFELRPIRKVCEHISREVEYIVTKATRLDPDDRYQSIQDLQYDIQNTKKLSRDFQFLLVKQVATYIMFAILYVLFFYITYVGYSNIKKESFIVSNDLIEEGFVALSHYKYDAAHTNFEKATKVSNFSEEAYIGILTYFEETAQYKQGIDYIKQNKNLYDHQGKLNDSYSFYLAKYYFRDKNYIDAYELFERLVSNYPEHRIYLLYTTLCNIHLGRPTLANKNIETLKSISTTIDELSYIYAEQQKVSGDFIRALDYYDEVITNSENTFFMDAYIQKASIYKNNLEFFENGLELYLLTLEQAQKDYEPKQSVTLLQLKVNGYTEKSSRFEGEDQKIYLKLALENALHLLELDHSSTTTYLQIAHLYRILEDKEAVKNILLSANDRFPDDFLINYHLTIILYELEFDKDEHMRDFKVAKRTFEKTKSLAVKQNMQSEMQGLIEEVNKLEVH